MNTGDMEKYCPKPHPVYFNAFSMWQQLSGSVQYLIMYVIVVLFYFNRNGRWRSQWQIDLQSGDVKGVLKVQVTYFIQAILNDNGHASSSYTPCYCNL